MTKVEDVILTRTVVPGFGSPSTPLITMFVTLMICSHWPTFSRKRPRLWKLPFSEI